MLQVGIDGVLIGASTGQSSKGKGVVVVLGFMQFKIKAPSHRHTDVTIRELAGGCMCCTLSGASAIITRTNLAFWG
jgi:G3E family GTPase